MMMLTWFGQLGYLRRVRTIFPLSSLDLIVTPRSNYNGSCRMSWTNGLRLEGEGVEWLTLIVVVCALIGLAGGVATTVEILLTPEFANFTHFKSTVIVWLGAECLVDILITAILGGREFLVSFVFTFDLVHSTEPVTCKPVSLRFTGLRLAFNIPLCKLYTNSLLSSLNARNPQAGGSGSSSGKFGLVLLKRSKAQSPRGSRSMGAQTFASSGFPRYPEFTKVATRQTIATRSGRTWRCDSIP
ncbi:hypothetical protein C8R45DRAFT_927253 [Mycena sanguinolenta]|nr:hypothetical protein C8R45DRAFT_927253 [Mycena sanguinolenta]